jgi:hypothetical protein
MTSNPLASGLARIVRIGQDSIRKVSDFFVLATQSIDRMIALVPIEAHAGAKSVIDMRNEEILTFQEAVERLPRRRQGKRSAPSTIYRWSSGGLRGVVLESICIGGTRCTSVEALERFFDRLTARSVTRPASDPRASQHNVLRPSRRSTAQHPEDPKLSPRSESALQDLDEEGWVEEESS